MSEFDFTHLKFNVMQKLKIVCDHLLTPGKGILTADESPDLMAKRMDAAQINRGPEYIKRFRSLLFDTPDITNYLNGILMYPDTAFERAGSASIFHTDFLRRLGLLSGAKFDMGKSFIPGTYGERTTIAPDILEETMCRLTDLGFEFAKWRSVIKVGHEFPSELAVAENTTAITMFCAACQKSGIFPVIQIDWTREGDYDMECCSDTVSVFLSTVFSFLRNYGVYLEAVIVMMKMIVPGKDSSLKLTPQEIAKATLNTLQRGVPPAVPGITFCTGDLDDDMVTECLNEVAVCFKEQDMPWKFTFSMGRGLYMKALKTWGGIRNTVPMAQKVFVDRLQVNCTALTGKYIHPAKLEEEMKKMQTKKTFRS